MQPHFMASKSKPMDELWIYCLGGFKNVQNPRMHCQTQTQSIWGQARKSVFVFSWLPGFFWCCAKIMNHWPCPINSKTDSLHSHGFSIPHLFPLSLRILFLFLCWKSHVNVVVLNNCLCLPRTHSPWFSFGNDLSFSSCPCGSDRPANSTIAPALGGDLQPHRPGQARLVGIFQPPDHSDVFRGGHMTQVSSGRPRPREKSRFFPLGSSAGRLCACGCWCPSSCYERRGRVKSTPWGEEKREGARLSSDSTVWASGSLPESLASPSTQLSTFPFLRRRVSYYVHNIVIYYICIRIMFTCMYHIRIASQSYVYGYKYVCMYACMFIMCIYI